MSILSTMADPLRAAPAGGVDWHAAMRRAIRDPGELCRVLELPDEFLAPARAAAERFGLFVPWEFAGRIEHGNPQDPLLRQVLPLGEELRDVPGFVADPVGDLPAQRAPGLLQKYHGRALLVVTGACPVHCRYCFRRHFPYSDGPNGVDGLAPAVSAVARDDSIEEVILSGGDPLTVVDEQLARLVNSIAEIPHVWRLRLHTRMPIMVPQRVTAHMVDWIAGTRLAPVVVLHANHARELDEAVKRSLAKLADAGTMLLNQSVLLRGVNDDAATLIGLSKRLVDCRVLPYYVHQLDRVAGAAHFEVEEDTGKGLIEQMRRQLPGYLVPRYVRETPQEGGKTIIS